MYNIKQLITELHKHNILVADPTVFYQIPSLHRSATNKLISAKLKKKGLNFDQLIKDYLQELRINQYNGNFNCQIIIPKKHSARMTVKLQFKHKDIFELKISMINNYDSYFQNESDAITLKTHIIRALSIDKKTIIDYQEWAFNQKFKINDFFDFMQILVGTNPKESLEYLKKRISYTH